MHNQVFMIGRLVSNPELNETEAGNKITRMVIAVPRSFKNADGEYETDFVPCVLWKGVAENVCEYCRKGDLVGVKGHLQSGSYEDNEGKKKYTLDVIVEKVSFLSSRREE